MGGVPLRFMDMELAQRNITHTIAEFLRLFIEKTPSQKVALFENAMHGCPMSKFILQNQPCTN